MVDASSISRAAEYVNSLLYNKGYFNEKDSIEKLLFKSIDDSLLDTDERVKQNDKTVLNVIHLLLQDLDKLKLDKSILQEEISDKAEIIRHFQKSNKDLNLQNNIALKEVNQLKNQVELANIKIKKAESAKHIQEKNLSKEKNLVSSVKVKAEKELRKKNLMINQLQDKLINRKRKYDNLIHGNNYSEISIDSSSTLLSETFKSSILDDELEKMLINLGNLITNLTLKNDKNIKFIKFLVNYLHLLKNYYSKKLLGRLIDLPPTPRFYHENYNPSSAEFKTRPNELDVNDLNESMNNSDDNISQKITQMVDIQNLESSTMKNLEEFYDLITHDESTSTEQRSSKIQKNDKTQEDERLKIMQKEVDNLKKNLEIALETNEKWSKRFKSLNKDNK